MLAQVLPQQTPGGYVWYINQHWNSAFTFIHACSRLTCPKTCSKAMQPCRSMMLEGAEPHKDSKKKLLNLSPCCSNTTSFFFNKFEESKSFLQKDVGYWISSWIYLRYVIICYYMMWMLQAYPSSTPAIWPWTIATITIVYSKPPGNDQHAGRKRSHILWCLTMFL